MAYPVVSTAERSLASRVIEPSVKNEAYSSGVSWTAVIAGAVVAAAISLTLLALGTGVGLASVSPWSNAGASAAVVSGMAIGWLVVSEMIASSMGGYLAGRLRTRWVSLHTDEVYFRDTAHGFLVWAVSLVIAAAFLASAATLMAGRAVQSNTANISPADPNAYFVDALFRSDAANPNQLDQSGASVRAEVETIFAHGMQQGISASDKTYLGRLVAARTGLSQNDAEQRVSETLTEARQAADNARKATSHLLYWTFFALLVGAFCASFAATIGGRQRDRVVVI